MFQLNKENTLACAPQCSIFYHRFACKPCAPFFACGCACMQVCETMCAVRCCRQAFVFIMMLQTGICFSMMLQTGICFSMMLQTGICVNDTQCLRRGGQEGLCSWTPGESAQSVTASPIRHIHPTQGSSSTYCKPQRKCVKTGFDRARRSTTLVAACATQAHPPLSTSNCHVSTSLTVTQ